MGEHYERRTNCPWETWCRRFLEGISKLIQDAMRKRVDRTQVTISSLKSTRLRVVLVLNLSQASFEMPSRYFRTDCQGKAAHRTEFRSGVVAPSSRRQAHQRSDRDGIWREVIKRPLFGVRARQDSQLTRIPARHPPTDSAPSIRREKLLAC